MTRSIPPIAYVLFAIMLVAAARTAMQLIPGAVDSQVARLT